MIHDVAHDIAASGLWTPIGAVLCFECHGPKFPRKTYTANEMAEHNAYRCAHDGEARTHCNRCGKPIWTREDVAVENEIGRTLNERGIECGMWQTGGMCSALVAQVEDPNATDPVENPEYSAGWDIVLTDELDTMIGVYRVDPDNGWEDPVDEWTSGPHTSIEWNGRVEPATTTPEKARQEAIEVFASFVRKYRRKAKSNA